MHGQDCTSRFWIHNCNSTKNRKNLLKSLCHYLTNEGSSSAKQRHRKKNKEEVNDVMIHHLVNLGSFHGSLSANDEFSIEERT